jgi:cell wall-associated NlpC family hydrolase
MKSPVPMMPTPVPGVVPMNDALEVEQRAEIVRLALSWVGTPYRQWGARKGVAVDCAMLLVRCWVEAGVFQNFDPRPYPPEWHLHREEERYLNWLESLAVEVVTPRPGDIAVFRFGRCYSHAGIMISATRMVHANGNWVFCSLSDLTESQLAFYSPGLARPRKFFDVWAKLRTLEEAA